MSFAATLDRARTDFTVTPRLELTIAQAVRLWGVGVDDCRFVIDALVDAGFLAWTARRTIVRRGLAAVSRAKKTTNIRVARSTEYDNAVGS